MKTTIIATITLTMFAFSLVNVINLKKENASLKSTVSMLEAKNKSLLESQNVMVWTMDKSCYDQINNSIDGILRLKIGKGVTK